MDPTIAAILTAQKGVGNASQVTAAGVSRHVLRRSVLRKDVLRLAHGILVDPAVWKEAAEWDRHAIRARGLMHGPCGVPDGPVALSHHSALSVMELPLFGVDDMVHIVRSDGRRSSPGTLITSHTAVEPEWVTTHEGVRVVAPARAALQVAGTFGVEAGLVSADACLARKLCSPGDLQLALDAGGFGNGRTQAQLVADHADGRSESAGESRLRWILKVLGLTGCVPQAELRDGTGQFIARVDFLCEEHRTVIEFDGMNKYTEAKVLRAEKAREDAIRSLGYVVVRITWSDLKSPAMVRYKITQGFRLAKNLR